MNSLLKTLDADTVELILVGTALLAILSVIFLFSSILDSNKKKKASRLSRVSAVTTSEKAALQNSILVKSNEKKLDQVLMRYLPNPEKLRARLRKTGYSIRPAHYLLICATIWATETLFLLFRMDAVPIIAVMTGFAGGLFIPHVVVTYLINKRKTKFLQNFPEALDIMVRGLKAGLPVTESIAAVGREAAEPVGSLFRSVADQIKVGDSLEEAITAVSRDIEANELKFFAITLSVQRETGGNLAETLENLSEILRKRRQMQLKIKAVSSEARASAMILGSLPFVMFCLIYLVSNEYIMGMLNDPRGHVLIAAGLTSMTLGIAVMAKMVRFEI
ncbi:type II secretion system F family protein [Kiloniella sp. b19]|uniref:type II secretion system F family protein n=1 Tax=Kiloniella sp. GXU_MW_B19 TaxID=3141326 RepID=UPI0031CDECBE